MYIFMHMHIYMYIYMYMCMYVHTYNSLPKLHASVTASASLLFLVCIAALFIAVLLPSALATFAPARLRTRTGNLYARSRMLSPGTRAYSVYAQPLTCCTVWLYESTAVGTIGKKGV